MTRPIRRRPEEGIQRDIVSLWQAVGDPRARMTWVPIGYALRPGYLRGIASAMGAHAGWPDLTFVDLLGRAHFMECKSPSGILSVDQEAFAAHCARYGWPWALVRSVDEAAIAWRVWGLLKPGVDVRAAA